MGGKRKKKKKILHFFPSLLPLFFPSLLPLFFPSLLPLFSIPECTQEGQRKGTTSKREAFPTLVQPAACFPPPNSCPKIVVLRRARSWNNLVRRVLPRVADTNPTLASCSFVRVYRGRESSLTSPGATSFLHDLNVDTYTYIYASACTVGDFEAKLRLPSCFSRPRYRTSPTKRF